ncbi:ATG16 domain-containing protein [Rhizoctonia solani AG-1 IA]|uniref:ATG16 domain-containing protein n=1 Tax=Thanatephorus cucumeris (strain AG1-IA) TaxID=983506 RepID=L8X2J8_THACA|nr:ATG16 domain-containing protein [Rhizoctonia solani AG-1 IA]
MAVVDLDQNKYVQTKRRQRESPQPVPCHNTPYFCLNSVGWTYRYEELRQRLLERTAEETAYAGIIEQYRRLAQQARLLNERNASLLRAVGSVQSQTGGTSAAGTPGPDNPVRVAYVVSLESQITALRDELAAVYKTQGQNAQRLLSMNETLREKEEQTRLNLEELRHTKEELERLRKITKDHKEQIEEKNRALQVLTDEAQAHHLEMSQIEQRNEELKKDNAGLLQRWLDHMNDAANKMNHANYTELRTAGWASQPGSTATSELGDDIVDVTAEHLSASGKVERNGASIVCGCSSPIDVGTAIGINGQTAVAWYEARRAVAERDVLMQSKVDEEWSVVDAPEVEVETTDTTSNNPGTDDWEQCSPVAD